jgi:ABC-type Na+ efflux pump permease subunit
VSAYPRAYLLPGDTRTLWLIGRRAALESLRDRMTLIMSVFFAVVMPIGLLLVLLRPIASDPAVDSDALGGMLTFYLLIVGLAPAVSAVGIAAGQFAGEKERGVLTPLLASPASNVAIFGGKVLGAIMPPLGYAVIGELVYLLGIAVVLGPARVILISPVLAAAMLCLVPEITALAATVASLISSRVRTFNSAQQLAGLALIPVWGVVFGLVFRVSDWGPGGLIALLLGLLILDVVLVAVAAAIWRREEVLSQI